MKRENDALGSLIEFQRRGKLGAWKVLQQISQMGCYCMDNTCAVCVAEDHINSIDYFYLEDPKWPS